MDICFLSYNVYINVVFSFKGTLIIIGGMYLNVIACGLVFRPTSFYKKPKRSPIYTAPESETLLNGDKNTSSSPSANGNTNGNQSQEAVRYRTTSTGSVVFSSIDSLHTVVLPAENQSADNTADDKHATKGGTKCFQFLSSLLDFSVIRSYIVMVMVAFSFLLFFGHFNFILFMPATASSRGVSHYHKAYLVSITGVCDLCGRLLIGLIGDLQLVERYKLFAASSIFCGLSILAFSFVRQYWLMAVCVGFYGFLGGCYVAITAPVIVDMVGMTRMPKVFGVVLFIQGLGAAFGQPLLGERLEFILARAQLMT